MNYIRENCNLLITSSSNKSTLVEVANSSLKKISKKSKIFCTRSR